MFHLLKNVACTSGDIIRQPGYAEQMSEAILIAKCYILIRQNIQQDPKKTFKAFLHTEKLQVEKVNENLVGNSTTINLSIKFENPLSSIKTLNESDAKAISSHQMLITQHKTASKLSPKRMEEHIGTLTPASESYKLIRNQFLTTYKPNYMGNKMTADRNIINN